MKIRTSSTIEMRRRLRLAAMLGATALAAPFAATPALAQSSEDASVDSNTIIVTAQRRNEALEDVPMTVTVVSPEMLSATGVNTVRDLANVTTGFQIGNSGSYPQPAIRGITTTNAGAYENNVAVFMDGLYQATPQVLNMDLPNVQDIQILKGPQGTLYGRNATGGAIIINTIDPGDTWTGNVEATYGRFDDKRGRAFIAGPLTDGIGFSVAGTIRHTDGYYKKASRTTPGQFDGNTLGMKQESVRAKLKFDLGENFRATLGYNYTHADDARGILFTPIENVPNSYAAGTGRETRPRNLGEVAGDIFILNFKQHEGSLKLEWDTGIGTLRSVTGYAKATLDTRFDFGGSYVPDNYSASLIRDRVWQENLDFNIDAIQDLDLVIGGNYYNLKLDYDPNLPNAVFLGAASLGAYADPATTAYPISGYRRFSDTFFFRTKEAWAVFADATFHATDRLSINVGGRYSKEKQNVSGYKLGYSLATGLPTSCAYSRNGETNAGFACGANVTTTVNGVPVTTFESRASAKQSNYSKFTPRASVRYEISPGTNIYASYSKGFRGGEWNSVIPGDNPATWFDAKQESIEAYEIGFKSAGRRLRFEMSAFYYDYKDLQVSVTTQICDPACRALVILQNAPSAEVYGAEASFDFDLTDDFKIRGGATWLHARYGDNFVFSGSGVNPAVAGFNSNSDPLKTLGNRTLDQDLSGLQMSRAPDFTGFLGFEYNIPQGDGGLRIAANVKYTASYVVTNPSIWGGDTRTLLQRAGAPVDNSLSLAGTPYADRSNEQRARQSGYALVNASVTWTDPSNHYYVRVWGNNLTDVKYKTHYNPLASGTYSPIGEPLTFGGTIGYKF